MKLSCSQMEILMSFYLEGELSPCLKEQADLHLRECENCAAKYKLVKTLFSEIKTSAINNASFKQDGFTISHGYKDFENNLSAYMDNELSGDDSIKFKKLAISNKQVRKELEDSYNIRRLMRDSYKKSKAENRTDFTKKIIKQLQLEEEIKKNFSPAIRFLIIFTVSILVLFTIILVSLSI